MQLAIDYISPAIVRRALPELLLSYGESSTLIDHRSLMDICIAGIQAELNKSSAWQNVRAEGAEPGVDNDDEVTDVFSLNRVPPKYSYQARAKFYYVGRGKPMPYNLNAED
jgi:hypothetical protein